MSQRRESLRPRHSLALTSSAFHKRWCWYGKWSHKFSKKKLENGKICRQIRTHTQPTRMRREHFSFWRNLTFSCLHRSLSLSHITTWNVEKGTCYDNEKLEIPSWTFFSDRWIIFKFSRKFSERTNKQTLSLFQDNKSELAGFVELRIHIELFVNKDEDDIHWTSN